MQVGGRFVRIVMVKLRRLFIKIESRFLHSIASAAQSKSTTTKRERKKNTIRWALKNIDGCTRVFIGDSEIRQEHVSTFSVSQMNLLIY